MPTVGALTKKRRSRVRQRRSGCDALDRSCAPFDINSLASGRESVKPRRLNDALAIPKSTRLAAMSPRCHHSHMRRRAFRPIAKPGYRHHDRSECGHRMRAKMTGVARTSSGLCHAGVADHPRAALLANAFPHTHAPIVHPRRLRSIVRNSRFPALSLPETHPRT